MFGEGRGAEERRDADAEEPGGAEGGEQRGGPPASHDRPQRPAPLPPPHQGDPALSTRVSS